MYELVVALALSPGNKAQTRKNNALFVVCRLVDKLTYGVVEYIYTLDHISEDKKYQGGEVFKMYGMLLTALVEEELDPITPIWYPIGYTPIPDGSP